MYWFRLLDCFHDDCPGLRALLGQRRFTQLAEGYLTKHPSSSFTLRNLCSRLADFIRANPKWTAPHTALAVEIARFEWAQTVAFDEAALPVVSPDKIAKTSPAKLRLRLQPYVTLLALQHPIDDYVIAVKKRDALRNAASNATTSVHESGNSRRVPRPKRERVWLAVHRLNNRLYYKRLSAPAFKVLSAIKSGEPLAKALAAAGTKTKPEDIREWFATWTQLGWLCERT
jgi:hypothetical protein